MKDDFLLELYSLLTPDARSLFDALRQQDGPSTMERLMLAARITNQQIRKGVGAGLHRPDHLQPGAAYMDVRQRRTAGLSVD